MNFKNTSILLSLLFCNLKVFSFSINENELSSNLKDNYDISESVTSGVNIPEGEIYDTLPDDDIDAIIKVTDAVIDEETDSDSDEDATVLPIDTDECTSKECIEISKIILSSMDTSVNPCDNFYEFSCGGWMAMNKDKKNHNTLRELDEKTQDYLGDMLVSDFKANENLSPKEKEFDEKLFNITKNTYAQCVNSFNRDYIKDGFLLNYINNFNISSERLSDRDEFASLLAELNNNNINILFAMNKDYININGLPYKHIPSIDIISTKNFYKLKEALLEIELSKEELTSRRKFQNEEEYNKYLQQQKEIIENYKEYARKILQVIYPSDTDKINSMIESIIEVERRTSQALIDSEHITPHPIYFSEQTDYENDMESERADYYDNMESERADYYDNMESERVDYYDNMESENVDYYDDFNSSTDYIDYSENTEGFDDNDYDDDDDNIVNIETLNEKYPLINWKLYFENIFKYYGIEVPISEKSLIHEGPEFRYFYEYFEKINNNDLVNYIEWNVIENMIDFGEIFKSSKEFNIDIIPEELIQIFKQNEESQNGNENRVNFMKLKNKNTSKLEEEIPVFKGNDANSKCLNVFSQYIPLLLSKYYVETKFPESIKPETRNMVENIRNAMIKSIQELEWLDESTRKYAIEKVLKIKYILGYSDFLLKHEVLYNYFKPLENVQGDILSLLMSIANIRKRNEYISIYNENPENVIDEFDLIFISPTYVANAYYKPGFNIMDFPGAILQMPNFDVNQPDYINYGNIGSIIGHEFTHAFDNTGKKFDAEGNEINWWTDNDNEEFNEFAQCFIDQYSNYSTVINGKKLYVNGEKTLGENLADNGGVDRAFEAWKMSIENNPEMAEKRNMKLPGLSQYSLEQLFYISYGYFNCEANIDETFFNDEHAPGVFRTNGVVSNSKRFAKIFNCPTNSPMNPEHKCTLW